MKLLSIVTAVSLGFGLIFGIAYGRQLDRLSHGRAVVTMSADVAAAASSACQARAADPTSTWEFIQMDDVGHILAVTCKEDLQ